MPKPSYIDGMYPLVGRPRYPSLWNGCVGAWAPCLGPSGLTLFDWSGFKNHGTLTNMDPATDWAISGGRYALDIDGTDDYVQGPTLPTMTAMTVSVWIKPRTVTAQAFGRGIVRDGTSFVSHIGLEINRTAGRITSLANGSAIAVTGGTSLTQDVWCHVCLTRTASYTHTIYLNARSDGSGSNGSPDAISAVRFGMQGTFANGSFDGELDDIRIYNRVLSDSEIHRLASRRGIAYEVEEQTIDPGTNRRRRVLIGA